MEPCPYAADRRDPTLVGQLALTLFVGGALVVGVPVTLAAAGVVELAGRARAAWSSR